MVESAVKDSSVSVVIPTLGGDCLIDTIVQLNKGTVTPDEILVCIPSDDAFKTDGIVFSNVKIIKTVCRGQVSQRIEGFKKVNNKYVMQLDDDITVDEYCIEILLETIKQYGPNASVAPSFIDLSTGCSVYKKPNRNRTINSIYYWLMNGDRGYQPGKIDRSGTPVGIDAKAISTDIAETEWLAGGCVMHSRDNLVLDNYYPFKGKAFSEDVIHSLILRNKNIQLFINTRAICLLEIIPSTANTFTQLLANIKSDYRARKYYLAMDMTVSSGINIRSYIYYGINVISYLFKKII